MRICILRHFYFPADPRVRREVEALSKAGYEVDLICLRKHGERSKETVAGASVYRFPLQHRRAGLISYAFEYGLFLLFATIMVSLLHLRRGYRVVQVNNMPDFLVFAAAIPKLLGARIVFDSHDPIPELYVSKRNCGENSLIPRLLRLVEKWSCRFADHVITVSDICKDRLASRSIPPEACTIVMNVPNTEIFDPNLRKMRKNGSREEVGWTILYHGALIHRYGVDIAIRAMKLVSEKLPDSRLEVIGEGEHLPELRKLVSELGLEKNVNLWGRALPSDQIARAIADSDMAVVPHRGDPFTDGILPNKLLEYVAMGTPTVASRTSVVETYFDDSMLLFFEPDNERQLAEQILRVATDPDLAANLVTNANRFNAAYNWNNMQKVYCKVIDTFARDRNGPGNERNAYAGASPTSS